MSSLVAPLVNRVGLNSLWLAKPWRPAFWTFLVVLTAAILLFPFNLHYEYHPVQSAQVFGDLLPLFAVLYYAWVAILLLLLFSGGKHSEWENLALVCLFALVHFGIWTINTPYGELWDVSAQLGHLRYIQETGRITLDIPNVDYFMYPAFHLFNSSLSQVAGLGVFETRTVYLLVTAVLTAAALYLLFMKFLETTALASLAVILMVQGSNVARLQVFWPGNLAFVFLVLILAILARRHGATLGTPMPFGLITVLLLVVFMTSYLPTPFFFVFMLVGIYLIQKVAHKNVLNFSTVALFLVLFASWQMYWAIQLSGGLLAKMVPALLESLANPGETLLRAFNIGEGYVGEAFPLWARVTRLFWLVLILGFGGLLWVRNLVQARKLDSKGVLLTGAVMGVAAWAILSIFVLPPIHILKSSRGVTLASLFLIPIMLSFLSGMATRRWLGRHILLLLMVLVFVVSLPTFLSVRPWLYIAATYPYETSAGEFLQSAYRSEQQNIYSSASMNILYSGYLPRARFPSWVDVQVATSTEELWQDINQIVENFERSEDPTAVLVFGEKFQLPPQHPAAIPPEDPRWLEFTSRLSDNNRLYTNGHIDIYQRPPEF